MGGLTRRVKWLRDRTPSLGQRYAPLPLEEERHRRWVRLGRRLRRELTPPDVAHASELIRLFRMQGELPAFPRAEALIGRVLDWQPAPEGGRSRPATEAVVYRAIYDREPGLEHLAAEVPPEWRAAFEAADELGRRFLSMPPEVVARWWVESRTMREKGEPIGAIEEHARSYEEQYGISQELLTAAQGPDRDLLTDEEGEWMITESIADALWRGEWGWAIARQIRELEQAKAAKEA